MTVAGKVFAAVAHARLQQPVHHALGQRGHHARVAVEAAVANHGAFAVVQIQHRREAEVHAAGAQLAAQHITGRRGRIHGVHGTAAFAALFTLAVIHPHLAQGTHGGNVGETIGFEPLHAPAFVVHANQQVFLDRLDVRAQLHQLRAVFPVAGEQNNAAHQRVGQARAVGIGQRFASDVNDERGMQCGHGWAS